MISSKRGENSKKMESSKSLGDSKNINETKEKEIIVTTTMSKGYQITVPSVIRKALGLEPGDAVDFRMERGQAVLKKMPTREEQIRAMLKEFDKLNEEHEKRMTPEQKEFAKMTAGWTARQYREYIDSLPETKQYWKEKYGV